MEKNMVKCSKQKKRLHFHLLQFLSHFWKKKNPINCLLPKVFDQTEVVLACH